MKKILYVLLLTLTMSFSSSCSYTIYRASDLELNYDLAMTSAKEIQAKESIPIYHSDNDVPGEYEIIAYGNYHPLSVPIFAPAKRQQLKKFYKKAVLKAGEMGGNAVLVNSVGFFTVLSVSNAPRNIRNGSTSAAITDAAIQDSPIEKKDSVISNTSINTKLYSAALDRFESGDIYKFNSKQQSTYVDKLNEEIKDNIDKCKTLEEVDFVSRKIDALSAYYEKIGKQSRSVQRKIEGYQEDLEAVQKKLEKKLAKKAKKAGDKAINTDEKTESAINKHKNPMKKAH